MTDLEQAERVIAENKFVLERAETLLKAARKYIDDSYSPNQELCEQIDIFLYGEIQFTKAKPR